MRRLPLHTLVWLGGIAVLAVRCGDPAGHGTPVDAASVDAAPVDAARVDAAPVDAAPIDAAPDAGPDAAPDAAPDAMPDAAPTADASVPQPCGADCDADGDGLPDADEVALALRFEPHLWLSLREEGFRADRLPHFAVRPLPGGGRSIFYALAYFRDYGDPDLGGLTGHRGDSELIVVEVTADASQAWQVDRVFLSAHYQSATDSSGWYDAADLETSLDASGLAHPVVYVAEWKHGNYPDLGTCDQGGWFTDHCEQGTLEPLGIAPERHLGGPAAPLLDEVVVNGNPEWFFTEHRFCGWQEASPDEADRGDCCTGYATWLTAWAADDL